MAFTTLDTTNALVVVDLQTGVVSTPLAHRADDVVGAAITVIDAFRHHGLPIVFVAVAGSPPGRTDRSAHPAPTRPAGWTDLIPELDARPGDVMITKYARSAFSGTGLDERLRDLGVTQVVVLGIATSSGVESTARDAHERGYHVTLPVDAMTDTTLAAHQRSLENAFPRIAETGTTAELLRLFELTHS